MDEKFLKLTNAVYKALEYFPESDPLKNKAREKTLAIMDNLSLVSGTAGWASLQRERAQSQLSEDLILLLGYLKIAKTQGWMSSMNYLIISSEYERICKNMTVSMEMTQRLPRMSMEPKPHIEPVLGKMGAEETEAPKSFVYELSERQKKIVKFLEENGQAQVMDLQSILPNVTKRTIRRDIDELLEAGKIARMGEFNRVFYKISN
jgi:hypothetical protein